MTLKASPCPLLPSPPPAPINYWSPSVPVVLSLPEHPINGISCCVVSNLAHGDSPSCVFAACSFLLPSSSPLSGCGGSFVHPPGEGYLGCFHHSALKWVAPEGGRGEPSVPRGHLGTRAPSMLLFCNLLVFST